MKIFQTIAAILNLLSCVAGIVILWKGSRYVYEAGYRRGRKDACDWWCQAARDVEGMSQETKDEERWP